MFDWFFKNKKEEVDISSIGIDMHSHMISGIDDGSDTLDEAVSMIRKMEELGYQKVFTTPHIMWDCYKNTPEIISEGLVKLNQALENTNIKLRVGAAAEYFIDEHFMEMLNEDRPMLTLPGKRLLVELPYSTPLLNTTGALFKIIEKGYQPVLAHPERYVYFHSAPDQYKRLSDQGCELQLNILSLTDYYGEHISKMAEWLLRNKLITLLGTDAHRMRHLDLIKRAIKTKSFQNYHFRNAELLA